jgi:hypothetical protein
MLRDSQVDVLSTVGAFRVVPVHDLAADRRDIRSLREQGLLQTHTIVINECREPIAALTRKGRVLLEAFRRPRDRDDAPEQQFYAGVVKPRELAHDAQMYRLFQTERTQLEAEGASITRVVLDYEFKAEYHTYVHDQERAGVNPREARRAFARDHELPFDGRHIQFPDVRVEYETEEGARACRDLELATEHYSRSQVCGKQGAGFRVYRAAGAGGNGRRGGVPTDPHNLESIT